MNKKVKGPRYAESRLSGPASNRAHRSANTRDIANPESAMRQISNHRCLDGRGVTVLLMGAGLIGRPLAALIAALANVRRIRIIDRDSYTAGQALPADCGRPKAQVVAELIHALNPAIEVECLVADIEDVPLGWFRCDILLTALDSKRARMVANFAYLRLPIPLWIDAGVSAPWLVRISIFAQGHDAPCYECGLETADYGSELSYPCQPAFTPPPSNSPPFLGSLAASLQTAECTRLLKGAFPPTTVNRELVYEASSQQMIITRLTRSESCRFPHGAFAIRRLRRGPRRLRLRDVYELGPRGGNSRSRVPAGLEVPGKLFARELVCPCGARRSGLWLKGRLSASALACKRCGQPMSPTGTGLTNVLSRDALSPRDLEKPLSAFGFQPADIIVVSARRRLGFFELGAE